MPLLAHHDRGAGVLTERQDAGTRDVGILEQGERDHAVVVAGFRVVQDRGDLLQVRGTQEEVDVVKSLRAQQRQRFGRDGQHVLSLELFDADMLGGQQSISCFVSAEFEEFLILKRCGRHASIS